MSDHIERVIRLSPEDFDRLLARLDEPPKRCERLRKAALSEFGPHRHTESVAGCFRCDLSREEMDD